MKFKLVEKKIPNIKGRARNRLDLDEALGLKNSLKESASARAIINRLGKDDIEYICLKNAFNYDIKQARIDNKNKTYEIGMFKIIDGSMSTKNGKEFERVLRWLDSNGYKKVTNESLKEDKNIHGAFYGNQGQDLINVREEINLIEPVYTDDGNVEYNTELWFDVKEKFGLEPLNDDEWVNLYITYNPAKGKIEKMEAFIDKPTGSEEIENVEQYFSSDELFDLEDMVDEKFQEIKDDWEEYTGKYYLSENLKEDWAHFSFKSGSNPYIAKTEKEKEKILKKYKNKVKELKPNFYEINDLDNSLKEDLNKPNIITRTELLKPAKLRETFRALQDESMILLASHNDFSTNKDFFYPYHIVLDHNRDGSKILSYRHFGSSATKDTLENFKWLIEEIFDSSNLNFLLISKKEYYKRSSEYTDEETKRRNASLSESKNNLDSQKKISANEFKEFARENNVKLDNIVNDWEEEFGKMTLKEWIELTINTYKDLNKDLSKSKDPVYSISGYITRVIESNKTKIIEPLEKLLKTDTLKEDLKDPYHNHIQYKVTLKDKDGTYTEILEVPEYVKAQDKDFDAREYFKDFYQLEDEDIIKIEQVGYYSDDNDVNVFKYNESLKESLNKDSIKAEIEKAIRDYFKHWDDEDYNDMVKDYLAIEVVPTNDGRTKVEVRAELTYGTLSKIADKLDPIVQKIDKDAYFDFEDDGIINAYLNTKVEEKLVQGKSKDDIKENAGLLAAVPEIVGTVGTILGAKDIIDDVTEDLDEEPLIYDYDVIDDYKDVFDISSEQGCANDFQKPVRGRDKIYTPEKKPSSEEEYVDIFDNSVHPDEIVSDELEMDCTDDLSDEHIQMLAKKAIEETAKRKKPMGDGNTEIKQVDESIIVDKATEINKTEDEDIVEDYISPNAVDPNMQAQEVDLNTI